MICPRCFGAGRRLVQRHGERLMLPCDDPDCHAGQVSCCEGATPTADAPEPETIVVSEVSVLRKNGSSVIRAVQPVVYRVSQDPCGVWLADGPPDVHLASVERESLESEVHHMLGVMWEAYAMEDPEKLTIAAQRLRSEMRAMFYDTRDGVECAPDPECGPLVSETPVSGSTGTESDPDAS